MKNHKLEIGVFGRNDRFCLNPWNCYWLLLFTMFKGCSNDVSLSQHDWVCLDWVLVWIDWKPNFKIMDIIGMNCWKCVGWSFYGKNMIVRWILRPGLFTESKSDIRKSFYGEKSENAIFLGSDTASVSQHGWPCQPTDHGGWKRKKMIFLVFKWHGPCPTTRVPVSARCKFFSELFRS